jgi:hypothetical protein
VLKKIGYARAREGLKLIFIRGSTTMRRVPGLT